MVGPILSTTLTKALVHSCSNSFPASSSAATWKNQLRISSLGYIELMIMISSFNASLPYYNTHSFDAKRAGARNPFVKSDHVWTSGRRHYKLNIERGAKNIIKHWRPAPRPVAHPGLDNTKACCSPRLVIKLQYAAAAAAAAFADWRPPPWARPIHRPQQCDDE